MFPVFLSRDVLAIRCIKDYIILGVGNQLRVFKLSNFELITIADTDHQDVIHNIIASSDQLIIFGGRHLSIFNLQIQSDKVILEKRHHYTFNDWIIAAEFFSENSENIYILFAHNNIQLFNTLTGESKNICCEERCILYGGHLKRENPEEIVIFSCTVFQEILLWKVDNKIDYSSDVRVLHRLKGHKGVIFSVFYEPELKLITSTSDDRTIRLWQVVDDDDKISHSTEWENVQINLLTTMFGHTARVWKSIIVDNNIISIGEDSLICRWTLSGELCSKVLAHGGATVWSIEISTDKSTIITGGGDGAVNTWSIHALNTPPLIPTFIYNGKTPKFVSYLNSGTLVVFIDGGELLIYSRTNELMFSHNLPRYKSYCLMQISPDRRNIAFASQDGYIEIFEEHSTKEFYLIKIVEEKVIDSKIFSFQWLNNDQILICGAQGRLKVFNFRNTIENNSHHMLPTNKERWTTAALMIENLLICGDRTGSIYTYQTNVLVGGDPIRNPDHYHLKMHGKLGVQSISQLGKKLISTGRNGIIKYYEIVEYKNLKSLRPLQSKKMPMEWVSKILRSQDDFYVVGFKENEFMIFSINLNRVILSINCGGGHRSWDCLLKDEKMNFACIKNKQVHLLNDMPYQASKTLIPGFHTKEIHSLAVITTANNHKLVLSGSEDCSIRVSVLDSISQSKYDLRPLDIYDGHISNVITMKILSFQDYKRINRNMVFSGGGRAQLRVWDIRINDSKEKLKSEDVMGRELNCFMLKGTDKDRRKKPQNNEELYHLDPETRFMDLSTYLFQCDRDIVFLFVACSDGFIRLLIYQIASNQLLLSRTIPHFNRCIMKVHSFLHRKELILISMATDGFINLWNMEPIIDDAWKGLHYNDFKEVTGFEPFGRWKAHQSGINSYDFKVKEENEYLIVSGGDDNKISLSLFKILNSSSNNTCLELENNWESSSIHSAQITGVKFLMDDQLLSVALDQRIVLYDYTCTNGKLTVVPQKIIQTFVSDVQGLILDNHNDNCDETLVYVYGQGLQVLIHKNEKKKI